MIINPVTVSFASLIIQALIKYGPKVANQVSEILHKQNPTKEDYKVLFDLAEEPWIDKE